MAQDVFPATLNTWISGQLEQGRGGLLNINHHLMNTYAMPLRVYYLGTNSCWLGEADDVVAGFFASRLGKPDFLVKWQASGIRLRRWLMNSFCFYLKELRRQRKREQTAEAVDEQVTFDGDPDAAVDRASAISFVQQALLQAEQACREEKLDHHWQVFLRHHLSGASFQEIAVEFKVDAARATVMSRTATRKFRKALREVVANDGVAPEQIDHEIQALLQEIG
jgi:DNA-directed RNA polymerase specialized sigma24 family protein